MSITSDRISLGYNKHNNLLLEQFHMSLYGSQFVKDIPLHILPLGETSSSYPDYCFKLDKEKKEDMAMIIHCFGDDNRYGRSTLTTVMSEFVVSTAQSLVYNPILNFELFTEHHLDESGSIIQSFPKVKKIPGKVQKLGRRYFQWVDSSARDQLKKNYIIIPNSRVYEVKLPACFGSPRNHRRLQKTLVDLNRVIPDFVKSNLETEGFGNFDYKQYSHTNYIELTKVMRNWGWAFSSTLRDLTVDYYREYLRLKFVISMSILREHIIDFVNWILQSLDYESRIELVGVPTSIEAQEFMQLFKEGKKTFDEVEKFIHYD